jgi:ketosteroid isomerase-like protein
MRWQSNERTAAPHWSRKGDPYVSREDCQQAVDNYKRFWEAQDAASMADMFLDDGVFIDPRYPFGIKGVRGIREYYQWQLGRFTDPRVEYTRVLIDPPYAVAEWYSWLTRLNGERLGFDGLSIFEVRNGKLALQRDYYDTAQAGTLDSQKHLYRPRVDPTLTASI